MVGRQGVCRRGADRRRGWAAGGGGTAEGDRCRPRADSGGTGLSPTDRTPQATAAVIDYEVPGLADAIRRAGGDAVPTAMLSRGMAGVATRTLIVNLPGSTGGVKDGLGVLYRVMAHALEQISGGDHQSGGGM